MATLMDLKFIKIIWFGSKKIMGNFQTLQVYSKYALHIWNVKLQGRLAIWSEMIKTMLQVQPMNQMSSQNTENLVDSNAQVTLNYPLKKMKS